MASTQTNRRVEPPSDHFHSAQSAINRERSGFFLNPRLTPPSPDVEVQARADERQNSVLAESDRHKWPGRKEAYQDSLSNVAAVVADQLSAMAEARYEMSRAGRVLSAGRLLEPISAESEPEPRLTMDGPRNMVGKLYSTRIPAGKASTADRPDSGHPTGLPGNRFQVIPTG